MNDRSGIFIYLALLLAALVAVGALAAFLAIMLGLVEPPVLR